MDASEATPTFRISSAEIARRNRNFIQGAFFGIVLCLLVYMGHLQSAEKYNSVLLLSILTFVGLFALFHLYGHLRYVRKIRHHVLRLERTAIQFKTGDEVSRLPWSDIAYTKSQKRWREGESLMIKLKNGRIIRLVGYEEMSRLAFSIKDRLRAPEETSAAPDQGEETSQDTAQVKEAG